MYMSGIVAVANRRFHALIRKAYSECYGDVTPVEAAHLASRGAQMFSGWSGHPDVNKDGRALPLVIHSNAFVFLALRIGPVGCDGAGLAIRRDHDVRRQDNFPALFRFDVIGVVVNHLT